MAFTIIAGEVPVNDFGSSASDNLTFEIFDNDAGGGRIVKELKVELFGNGTSQATILMVRVPNNSTGQYIQSLDLVNVL
jgi:hypothetical protein